MYLDSKVDAADAPPDLTQAGTNIIAYVDKHLFCSGFKGQVVVSCPSTAYLQAAVAAAKSSPNADKYYFTIDGQSATANCLVTGVQAEEKVSNRWMRERKVNSKNASS